MAQSMIKTQAVNYAATTAVAGTEFGETPFFPGGNCVVRLSAAVSGTVKVQGNETTGTAGDTGWTDLATLTDQVTNVYGIMKYMRVQTTVAGTGTAVATFEGIQ